MNIDKIIEKYKTKKSEQKKQKIVSKERERIHKEMRRREHQTRNEAKTSPKGVYISLKDINKIYPNHVQAVFDFNLDIKEHEFIVFVGPSGCGKSTTLRMIAGLEDITSGDLFIDGEYVNELEAKDRKISMVFQSYALYPHMTVYNNMAFGLKVAHIKKDEIDERIKSAAKILQLTEYLDRKPNALSGGQCQRVALGRAICKKAKVFLMDEPLSNLDAKLRVQMRSEIVKLHNALNATTIYVTHDQTEAMTMATRIVVMNKGYIQQIGTPTEIYNSPANIFVATFVGSPSMNIFKAKISKNLLYFYPDYTVSLLESSMYNQVNNFYKTEIDILSTELEVKKNKLLSEINRSRKENISIDDDLITHNTGILQIEDMIEKIKAVLEMREPVNVLFGVRPEDVHRSDSIDSKSFSTKVVVAELLGSEYFIHAPFGDQEIVAKLGTKEKINVDDKLNLLFDFDKIHIFDPITTKKII